MATISLTSIKKYYGEVQALKNINLDIRDGEFLTLVGPSGCGKSTLLRIIAGLEEQNQGDIRIDGKEVSAVRASKRDLAMVFQSYALYPHLTVQNNMLTPLRLRDLTFWERTPMVEKFLPSPKNKVKDLKKMVLEVAQTLRIEHLLDRKPGQLSGGQRQRVALGRAMVRKPKAFLMDEPLSNLDAALRVHMRAELAELHRNLGTTFIYVTHDQAEALTMSDRLAVMMDGEIIQLGTPEEIYKNPRDRRVAEFIGSPKINFLQANVDPDGNIMVMGSNTGIKIGQKVDSSVQLGIRPEHLSMANGNTHNGIKGWPFKVTHKENLGSDYYLHGHINGSKTRVIARAKPDEVNSITPGSEITLSIKNGASMVFDSSNLRIDSMEEKHIGSA